MIGIGSSVGHYVVRAKLGEGAMGTVYLGQHHVLDARVAIKVIRRDAERTEEDVSRFFTEARSASRIGHDNIVSVHDFGRTADGDPYYIMELLTGESLAARLARGRQTLAEVRHLGVQIADALAASHGKGIVHRDLKPGNVFLVRRAGDAQFVKLLDFGVAKLTEDEAEEQRGHRTNTGRLLGTPHYMAPEQVAGRRTIDGRADVYALGVLLFEMVCGRLPFDAPKWTEVLIQHVTQAPPRVADLVPGCPAWLDRLVDRALAKSPAERPDMAAMRDALRAEDDAALVPLPGAPGLPVSLPPTAPPGAPTMSSETQIASADTVASDAQARAAQVEAAARADRARRTRNRARRSATLLVLALGAGGTALGAVVVVATRGGGPAEVQLVVLDAGTHVMPSLQPRIDRIKHDRWALLDAGVHVDDEPPPGPATTPGRRVSAVRAMAPVAVADAAPPLPDHLDDYDVEHALGETTAAVAACNDQYYGVPSLDVTLVVGGDGQVIDVKFGSQFVATPFSWCVTRAVEALAHFPPSRQAAQEIPWRYEFAPLPPGTSAPTVTPGGSVARKPLRSASSATPPRP